MNLRSLIDKIRRICGLTSSVLPEERIMEVLNHYWTAIFPAELRAYDLRSEFSFVTSKGVVSYSAPSGAFVLNPLAFVDKDLLEVFIDRILFSVNRVPGEGQPLKILFSPSGIEVSPVPDKEYTIILNGIRYPKELITEGELNIRPEWFNVLAYGTSMELFAEFGDTDSYQKYSIQFERYKDVAMSHTYAVLQYLQQPIRRPY